MMSEIIKTALGKLDPKSDDHWTGDGLPRLDVVKDLAGKAYSRQEVTDAAKGFCRANVEVLNGEPEPEPEQVDPAEEQTKDLTAQDDSDEELSGDELIVKELEDASVAKGEADQRYKKATDAHDVLITRNAQEQQTTQAQEIQAFQKSQLAQRVAAAKQKQRLAAALLKLDGEVG